MALNCTEKACWVTPNDSVSSSCVWLWSSSSNASNYLSSNFFGCPERDLSSTLKSPSLKPFPTWFISWSSVIINFDKHSMGFSRTFLPIKAENQNLPQMLLVNKFDISNTVKIKVFVWNSKRYKLNIISRCLISLKPPKSAITMNHSQQLESFLGKRTEFVLPMLLLVRIINRYFSFSLRSVFLLATSLGWNCRNCTF